MPMPQGDDIAEEPDDTPVNKQVQEHQQLDMDADISLLEAPTFTTISRGPPEPMLRLNWDHRVNLVGEKVLNPMIHVCDQCNKPILIYGRMIPCKHVFCLKCAKREEKICPRCNDKVHRVEHAGLGTVFMCVHGGSRYGVVGCRRTYLSQRDLHAHINHRHNPVQSSDMNNSQFNSHLKESSGPEKMMTGPVPSSHSSHHSVPHPHPVSHPTSHALPHSIVHPSHSLSHAMSHPSSSHSVPHPSHPPHHSVSHPPPHSMSHPSSMSHPHSSAPPQSRKSDSRNQEPNHHRSRGGPSPPPPPPPPYAPMQHRQPMIVAPPGYAPSAPPPTQNSMRTNLITVPIQDVEMTPTTYHHHYSQPPPVQPQYTHSAYTVPPHQPPPNYYPPVTYAPGPAVQAQYVPQAVPPPGAVSQGVAPNVPPPGMAVRPQYHDNQYRTPPPPPVAHGQQWSINSSNPPPTYYR